MNRAEDRDLLRGATSFIRDLEYGDCDSVVFVRSHVAHGEITRIDVSQAVDATGVTAVLTGHDLQLEPFRYYDPIPEPFARPPLAVERVRMVGELIAVVVADSPAHAADAAELVEVDINELEPVLDARRANDPRAPKMFEDADSNVVMQYDRGRLEDLFELAAHVETGRYPNQRLASAPVEPNGVIARPSSQGLDLWATGQGVHVIRDDVARFVGMDEATVRVRSPAVGGGFGGRHSPPIEVLVVAAAAHHLGRALRWDETRTENLLSMVHGRAQDHTVEIGFDDDGLIVGLRVHNLADCGAYPHFGPLMPFMSRKLSCGPYKVPQVDYSWTAVATTTNTIGPYRGAGQPEVTNGLERTIENAARALNIDVLELRRRNFVRPDDFPYKTPTQLTYDSGDYAGALDRAAALVEYEAVRAEQIQRRETGERIVVGVGFSSYVSIVDNSPEYGSVEITADGSISVRCGTFSHGQSHADTVTGVVAVALGVPSAAVSYRDNDSDATPNGGGTGGSRSAQMAGGAAQLAAEAVLDRAKNLAARLLEADPADLVAMSSAEGFSGIGVVGVPSSTIGWDRLAQAAADEGTSLTEAVDYTPEGATHPSGTHASVVEVDLDTGGVRLRSHVAVDDCGTVLNAPVVEGQQHGGSAAGIGQALFEEIVFDQDGNPNSTTFADYLIPSSAELPSFITATMDIPSPESVTGAKGIGENGAIAAPTAVQNAVVDALSHLGVTHVDLPVTPERVWRAIDAASTARS